MRLSKFPFFLFYEANVPYSIK
ncbi:rCG20253 [Rattus norvegicus]|uniref:RCG20253 n=1 Tax=Rattus norvegicus TaxID=10116 RepID=A6JH16_RAT|nr:rCG20253 [Rattus norvegicus]